MNTKSFFHKAKLKYWRALAKTHKKGGVEWGGGGRAGRGRVPVRGNSAVARPPSCPGSDDEISCFPHQVTINLSLMGAMVLI